MFVQSSINSAYSKQSLTQYKLPLPQEQAKGEREGVPFFPGPCLAFCHLRYTFYYSQYDRKLDEGLKMRVGGVKGASTAKCMHC